MKRKITRGEMRETIVNLIDLGFTANAVSVMTGCTVVNVYSHLKKSGRMEGRNIVRSIPDSVIDASKAAMRRMFSEPECQALTMMALASKGRSAETVAVESRVSETRITSRRSAKKAA